MCVRVCMCVRVFDTADSGGVPKNPIDVHYGRLNCNLAPLDKAGAGAVEFGLVKDYVANTHAPTHRNYKLEVLEVFKLDRPAESARFTKWLAPDKAPRRMLLWHGSRTANMVGILSQGLRIA